MSAKSIFKDKYTWLLESPEYITQPQFIAYAENAEVCSKEIDRRIEEIDLLSSELEVKINLLFQEIQKAICFTQTMDCVADSKAVSVKSENRALQVKLRSYLKHVYNCQQDLTSFAQYMAKEL